MSTDSKDLTEVVLFKQTFKRLTKVVAPDNGPNELEATRAWIKGMFEYNVPHGKHIRGLAVVSTYKLLSEHWNKNVSEDDMELARILGWTVEILQAYFVIVDDMMDQSITRRGQMCWYKLEDVGLMSCNDAILLEQENYNILNKYFSTKKCYLKFVELIHEITRYTSYGQNMDVASNPFHKGPQFDLFTQSRYESIVKYKTGYYTFVLPVRLALYLAECDDEEEHKRAAKILLKIGYLFQVQDDYLDCFGDPVVTGKIGTDIEEGKCCWPIITAFKVCDDLQKETIKNNYGINDVDCVTRVKDIYKELDLKKIYTKEENKYFNEISKSIDKLSKTSSLTPKIFHSILNKIYKRQK